MFCLTSSLEFSMAYSDTSIPETEQPRIFKEKRKVKLKQLCQHLDILGDVISPENAFALYFKAYLEYKMNNRIPGVMLDRLKKRLDTSVYWAERLKVFGLKVEQLEKENFKEAIDFNKDFFSRFGSLSQA
jgi:hypothetical protein